MGLFYALAIPHVFLCVLSMLINVVHFILREGISAESNALTRIFYMCIKF